MIGGVVLDPATIVAFGRGDYAALFTIDEIDLAAQAIVVPMTAITEALTQLEFPTEARTALELLSFGVAVHEDLTGDEAETVATRYVTAGDVTATTLGMSHAAVTSERRGWPVLTDSPKRWGAAHPDIELAVLPNN